MDTLCSNFTFRCEILGVQGATYQLKSYISTLPTKAKLAASVPAT